MRELFVQMKNLYMLFALQNFLKKRKKSLQGFLFLLSIGYKALIILRNFFYDKKIFSAKRVGGYVVSVGNITAGGTGKTPFVSFLYKNLNKKTAIISRGYRSEKEHSSFFLLPDQNSSYETIGDEPFLLYKRHNCLLGVGKNRSVSAKKARANGAKILLFDDGFQHRKIHQDKKIVLLDQKDPFSGGYFLPRGFLRDSVHSLKRADLIVVNHADENFFSLKKELMKYADRIIGIRPYYKGLKNLKGEKVVLYDSAKVGAFCGIGNPDPFLNYINTRYDLVSVQIFHDHEKPSLNLLKDLLEKSRVSSLICTEKDAVKIPSDCLLPIYFLEMDIEVVFGKEICQKFLENIHFEVDNLIN